MTNKNSKVLALKYRPQTFEDLIGQDIIAETISNSIKLNKIPNAYLFTGIRGVGKTTTARIVAKALSCKNGFENLCKDNFCENCEAISNSSHIDIFELDAASQSSIENTRELIEFSRYAPTSTKYKIFILDECHMLSKQAWASLLKTLEEPPEYLKFIFATTEIKKIPITVISRCQKFDLSRIKSTELFDFIKKIKEKENGKASDDALKLIVKISEGSVRDALSLLDRALLSLDGKKELDLNAAQKIFGYFDKSQLIDLFILILNGNENDVIESYRKIYDQGIDPKIFINDFLEILYYFKNINSLSLESINFSLNDDEFNKIKELSKKLNTEALILFWQFTIKTLGELDIVSNQHISIEMFLLRLIHLKNFKNSTDSKNDYMEIDNQQSDNQSNFSSQMINKETINQIKNVAQEKKTNPQTKIETKTTNKFLIKSFVQLLEICLIKKEMKLKYELENNVNLVKFENGRIEISFNDNLDKNFVKDLSTKLLDWTGHRWIISFSKSQGEISIKDKEKNIQKKLIENAKKSELYKTMQDYFPDAELIDVKFSEKKDDN